jgi:soluble lytic murein transglycosylase-like protein
MILFFIIPIHAWSPPNDKFLIGEIDGLDARRARQVSDIYAVLESRGMRLNSPDLWKLARCIQEESEKHSLAPALVLAIIQVESQFDPRAVSSRGARGLMQIRSVAAEVVAGEVDFPDGKVSKTLHDPIVNVKVGTAYLRHLKEIFTDLKLTLVAYNWGPTRLRQTLAARKTVPHRYADKVFIAQRTLERTWMRENSLQLADEPHDLETG